MKRTTLDNKPVHALTYQTAVYQFAPVYEHHTRQLTPMGTYNHPMLADQIFLHRPLSINTPKIIHTAAKARSGQRGCLFWVEWQPSPLPDMYYAFEKNGQNNYLLVFIQPIPGHLNPFRLLVITVDEQFPKASHLWDKIASLLDELPALTDSLTND